MESQERKSVKGAQPSPFQRHDMTATGERRASVRLHELETLWFNTGSLCNLSCTHCYMRSSPRNHGLEYLALDDVQGYLDEIRDGYWSTRSIGFTGGEPFMAPEIVPMIEVSLVRGFDVLVLTNATGPLMRHGEDLLRLAREHPGRMTLRVSLDHYSRAFHETERGPGSWETTVKNLVWMSGNRIPVTVAGRTCWNESDESLRSGYATLFQELDLPLDPWDPKELVLFPELDADAPAPEISEGCWEAVGATPEELMCARSRMVIRRSGATRATVTACTLLPWRWDFEMGSTLESASGRVWLNHPYCAGFCVLGGGSCDPRAREAP